MVTKIKLAAIIAEEAHKGQLRKYTKEPYFNHCIAVAARVAEITDDEDMIAAAYLHDTVEDTEMTIAEIGKLFGKRVAELVYDLTDHFTPENYPNFNRKKRKNLEAKRLGTISEDAKKIKLCDLADNTSTIVELDPGFARHYLREKADVLHEMGYREVDE